MTIRRKLIEVALPLDQINYASGKQKTIGAAAHYQNLHRWWARRPSAAARAMLWASLIDDPSSRPDKFPTLETQTAERARLLSLLERLLPWEASFDQALMEEAHKEILESADGTLPKILDPFGGGGAIPLEAVRLGLPTFSGDLNPVAVLIQKAMLEIPQAFANMPPIASKDKGGRTSWTGLEGLEQDVLHFGRLMESRAREILSSCYPETSTLLNQGLTPVAWIWARTVRSPDPAWRHEVPLMKSWVLSKKKEGKVIWIEPKVDYESKRIRYHIRDTGHPTHGSTSRQGFNCVATGTSIPFSYIREEGAAGRIGAELVAVVCDSNDGRKFVAPDSVDHKPVDFAAPEFLNGMLQGKAANDVYKYGMKTWGSLFTPRQLKALVTFSELLTEVRTEIEALDSELKDDKIPLREGGCGRTAYADALVTYLAFVIDKCADFWSTICTWNAPNSQIRYTFSKQAIPMTWDFAEVNPFSEKTGSWDAMLRGVAKGIRTLPTRSTAEVKQRDAASRVREVGRCVVSTDPPYYDNISYSDLSDFFFVWLRHNLKDVWPDECATLLTPKEEELIADAKRAGSKAAAKAHFENGMETVFREAASNCDERYPATIFYAFKASETENSGSVSTGWETFLTGLLNSGFSVTATWPVRTEFANKIGIAAGDNMLASSIVLACRRRIKDAPLATRSDFVAALKREMRSSIRVLQKQNIAPVDLAQSAIGPGIAIFSSYSRVVEADGKNMTVRTALILINEILSEVLSGEEGSFDAETRFALTWYDQFGFGPGPYGDADICAKAKNTTVDAVIRSGLARSTSGRVALITKDLLPSEWNPATDQSLTIWEVTHHLIKSLEHSEQRAAELLQKAGPGLGESARQLAYLLFQIADQKRRTEDAATYNMLVTAWPQLQRLAAGEPSTTDESLF